MHGATVTKLPRKAQKLESLVLTPEMAVEMLEHNNLNRPLKDFHVKRIASQILAGKWRFNGDTIKIAETGDVLDGQHRLWAIIESKTPVETIVVRGVAKDAFSTIDTIRQPRSGADVLALCGATRYRNIASAGLQWLIRWQRCVLPEYRAPDNRVENSDLEHAFNAHPEFVRAVERAMVLRSLANPSIFAFLYYVLTNKKPELAERMMNTLRDPSGVSVDDPFFRLRAYFTADHHKRKEPLVTIALAIKAINAAGRNQKIKTLGWRHQGQSAEAFPALDV